MCLHRYAVGLPLARAALLPLFLYLLDQLRGRVVLALLIVYSVFKLAMEPLKGLQTLGMLVFKWAAGISVAVALGSAFTPI
jgi:hypothetical protein